MGTIEYRCTAETLQRVAAGRQPFLVLENTEVQEGDFISLVDPEARTISRRVEAVDSTLVDGSVVVGLASGTDGPVYAAFGGGGIMVGFALERRAGQQEIAQAPQYLPCLVCPPVDLEQVLEQLQVSRWPDGVFSILLAAQLSRPEAGRLVSDVRESLVLTLAHHDQTDVFCELDQRMLLEGRLQDIYGKTLEPYFGQLEEDDAAGQLAGSSLAPLLGDVQTGEPGGVE
jgi:hypothetical protein